MYVEVESNSSHVATHFAIGGELIYNMFVYIFSNNGNVPAFTMIQALVVAARLCSYI